MGIGVIKLAGAAARRRWGQRRYFASLGDWLVTLYDTLLRFAKRLPLPARGRAVPVELASDPQPVYLRLGKSDGFVMEEIFIAEVYAPVTGSSLGQVRQIVDLGANVGMSVRLWQRRFPEAQIIAVEPDANNFAACRQNVADDLQNRVQLIRACVGGKPGKAYLDRSAEECAFTMTDTPAGEPIGVLTLPMILEQCNFDGVIDILKVDIEGAEKELFADCAPWLERVRSIMIELHPNYSQEMLLQDLRSGGGDFRIEWTSETAGNPLMFLVRK